MLANNSSTGSGTGNDHNGAELLNSTSKSSKRLQALEDGYFCFLSNLRRKKPQHHRISLLAAVLDFIQLIPFVCLPTVAWPAGAQAIFVEVISRFRIAGLVIPAGFDAFRALYWTTVALTLLTFFVCCVSTCSAVRGRTQSTWFVRTVRRGLLLLPQALFISCLEILFIPWRCNYPNGQVLVDFPGVSCWGGANAPMAVVGVLCGILLIGMSISATLFQFDLNVQSRQPQAIANAEIPVTAVFLRTVLVICVVAMFTIPFWQAALIAAVLAFWFLQHLQEESYFSYMNNCIRGGALGALFFAASWQLATAFFNQPAQTTMGTILPIAAGIGAIVGYWFATSYLSSLDCTSSHVVRLNPETGEFVAVLLFEDTMQPEMCCRVLREIGVSQAGLDRANAVWNAALAQYGERPDVLVSHSRFLTTYSMDPSKANHALQKVKRLKTTFQQRYSLYLFEQEGQRLRSRTTGGDTSMDLTTYVAFQAQMKVVLRAHRRVLFEVRKFWRQVHAEDSLSSDGQLTMAGLPPVIPAAAAVTAAAAAAAASAPLQLQPASSFAVPATPSGGPGSSRSLMLPGTPGPANPGAQPPPQQLQLAATPANRRGSVTGPLPKGGAEPGTPRQQSKPPIMAIATSAFDRHTSNPMSISKSREESAASDSSYSLRSLVSPSSNAALTPVYSAAKRRASRMGPSSISRADSSKSDGGGGGSGTYSRSGSSNRLVSREEAARQKIVAAYRRSLIRFGYPKWFAEKASAYLPGPFVSWLLSGAGLATPAQQVGLRFSAVTRLAKLCARIDKLAEEATRTYASTLERYPKSSKLMRSYAKFELELNQNQRLASRLVAAADKLDEAAEENSGGKEGGFEGGFKASSLVDDNVDGLIVIDTRGLILSANRVCTKLFGYSEAELLGSNVSKLMPMLHSQHHDSYLRNYVTTGVAKVIGNLRKLHAKHREGYTFPIELAVSRVESPNGLTFAGIIHPLPEEENVALVDIDGKGRILNVSRTFCKLFGWPLHHVIGTNIKHFMPREYAKNHDHYISRYVREGTSRVVNVKGRRLQGLHHGGTTFPISLGIEAFPGPRTTVFSGVITEITNAAGVVTINEKGIVQTVNKALLSLFGYEAQNDLVGRNVKILMPEPYAYFHNSFLDRFTSGKGGGLILNKSSGRFVLGKHADGSTFPIHLKVAEVKQTNRMEKLKGGKSSSKDKDAGKTGKAAIAPVAAAASGNAPSGKRLFVAEITLAEVGLRRAALNKSNEKNGKKGNNYNAADEEELFAGAEAGALSEDDGNDASETDPLLGRISINDEGRILFVNQTACSMFGYKEEQLKGQNVKILTPPAIAAKHDGYLQKHKETGENVVIGTMGRHLVAQHANGTLFPVSLNVEEENVGASTSYHGSIRALADIEGVLFTDVEGKILNVNQGICFILGYRASELEGKNITRLMPRKYRKAHPGFMKRFQETGIPKFTGTRQFVPAVHSDGSLISIQAEIAYIRHAEYGQCFAARIVMATMTPEEAEKAAQLAVENIRIKDVSASSEDDKSGADDAHHDDGNDHSKTPSHHKNALRKASKSALKTPGGDDDDDGEVETVDAIKLKDGKKKGAAAKLFQPEKPKQPRGGCVFAEAIREAAENDEPVNLSIIPRVPMWHPPIPQHMLDMMAKVGNTPAEKVASGWGAEAPRDPNAPKPAEGSKAGSNMVSLPGTASSNAPSPTNSGASGPDSARGPGAKTPRRASVSFADLPEKSHPEQHGKKYYKEAWDKAPASFHHPQAKSGAASGAGGPAAASSASSSTPSGGAIVSGSQRTSSSPLALPSAASGGSMSSPAGPLPAGTPAALASKGSFRGAPGNALTPVRNAPSGLNALSAGLPTALSLGPSAYHPQAPPANFGLVGSGPVFEAARQRVAETKYGHPQPGDNKYIFSDSQGNAISFARAASLLGVVRPELEPGGTGDGPDPPDAHMEGRPGGWVSLSALGVIPGLQLPGKDSNAPDWREGGLCAPKKPVPSMDEDGGEAQPAALAASQKPTGTRGIGGRSVANTRKKDDNGSGGTGSMENAVDEEEDGAGDGAGSESGGRRTPPQGKERPSSAKLRAAAAAKAAELEADEAQPLDDDDELAREFGLVLASSPRESPPRTQERLVGRAPALNVPSTVAKLPPINSLGSGNGVGGSGSMNEDIDGSHLYGEDLAAGADRDSPRAQRKAGTPSWATGSATLAGAPRIAGSRQAPESFIASSEDGRRRASISSQQVGAGSSTFMANENGSGTHYQREFAMSQAEQDRINHETTLQHQQRQALAAQQQLLANQLHATAAAEEQGLNELMAYGTLLVTKLAQSSATVLVNAAMTGGLAAVAALSAAAGITEEALRAGGLLQAAGNPMNAAVNSAANAATGADGHGAVANAAAGGAGHAEGHEDDGINEQDIADVRSVRSGRDIDATNTDGRSAAGSQASRPNDDKASVASDETRDDAEEKKTSKHRLRQLKRVRRNQHIRHTISAITTTTVISAILLLVLFTVCFALDQYFTSYYWATMPVVLLADSRAQAFQEIAVRSRQLQLSLQAMDAPSFYVASAVLANAVNTAAGAHQELYLGSDMTSNLMVLSTAEITAQYTNPIIPVQIFMETAAPPTYETKMMNFWELGNAYVTSGFLLTGLLPVLEGIILSSQANRGNGTGMASIGATLSNFGAASTYSSSVSGSGGNTGALYASEASDLFGSNAPWVPTANNTLRDVAPWRFIMDNEAITVAQSIMNADLVLSAAQWYGDRAANFQLGLFLAEVGLLIGILALVMRPLYLRMLKERSHMFTLFAVIPRGITQQLANMEVRVGNVKDDGDGDGESDSSGSYVDSDDEDVVARARERERERLAGERARAEAAAAQAAAAVAAGHAGAAYDSDNGHGSDTEGLHGGIGSHSGSGIGQDIADILALVRNDPAMGQLLVVAQTVNAELLHREDRLLLVQEYKANMPPPTAAAEPLSADAIITLPQVYGHLLQPIQSYTTSAGGSHQSFNNSSSTNYMQQQAVHLQPAPLPQGLSSPAGFHPTSPAPILQGTRRVSGAAAALGNFAEMASHSASSPSNATAMTATRNLGGFAPTPSHGNGAANAALYRSQQLPAPHLSSPTHTGRNMSGGSHYAGADEHPDAIGVSKTSDLSRSGNPTNAHMATPAANSASSARQHVPGLTTLAGSQHSLGGLVVTDASGLDNNNNNNNSTALASSNMPGNRAFSAPATSTPSALASAKAARLGAGSRGGLFSPMPAAGSSSGVNSAHAGIELVRPGSAARKSIMVSPSAGVRAHYASPSGRAPDKSRQQASFYSGAPEYRDEGCCRCDCFGRCMGRIGRFFDGLLFVCLVLPLYGLWILATRTANVVGKALVFSWPMSMPRKVAYSVFLLVALLGANFGVVYSYTRSAEDGVLFAHLEARVTVLLSRSRFLSQELVYASSPLITNVFPQPPPAPTETSTTPDPNILAPAMRALVSLAQMTHAGATMGAAYVPALPGTGDGVINAAALAAAGIPNSLPIPTSYIPQNVYPAGYGTSGVAVNAAAPISALDVAFQAELLGAFSLSTSEAASLPSQPVAASLSDDAGGFFFSQKVTSLLLMPQCLRSGGTLLGKLASSEQQVYAANYQPIRNAMGYPFNTTWPVVLPADPSACPPPFITASASSQNGLDVAIKGVLASTWLLANQTGDSLHVPWNAHNTFIQNTASLDAADGLYNLLAAVTSGVQKRLNVVHLAGSIFYVAYVAVILLWYIVLLRPYIATVGLETSRVAALLSFLPSGVDLQKLMVLHQHALKMAIQRATAAKKASSSMSSSSSRSR